MKTNAILPERKANGPSTSSRQTAVAGRLFTRPFEANPRAFAPLRIKSILIPIDFSEPSLRTLDYAAAFAKQFGAKLTLLHVMEPIGTPDFGASFPLIMQREKVMALCKDRLELLIKQHALDPKQVENVIVREGRSFQEITEAARGLETDLIVLATQGHTGLKHVLLGSTAERVVRHAPCPVLVIRARQDAPAKPQFALQKVLVPIDFSGCSRKALEYVVPLAQQQKSQVRLLHVVAPIPYYGQGDSAVFNFGVSEPDYAAIEAELRAGSTAELSKLVTNEVPPEVSTKTMVCTGYPAIEILKAAEGWPADLIVISTHGRTGLKHVFIGSVAEQVVQRAPCAVLVVR